MARACKCDVSFSSKVRRAPARAQLDQALAPSQALPVVLASPRALEVVGEQEKDTGSHTCLTCAAFPKPGEVPLSARDLGPKKRPSPAHLPRRQCPPLPALPQWAPDGPTRPKGGGRGPPGLRQARGPAPRPASAATRANGGAGRKPAPGPARFPPSKQWPWRGGGGAAASESWSLLPHCPPVAPFLVWDRASRPAPARAEDSPAPPPPDPWVAVPAGAGLVFQRV